MLAQFFGGAHNISNDASAIICRALANGFDLVPRRLPSFPAAVHSDDIRRSLHAGAAAAMPVTDLDVERTAHLVSTGQCTYLDVR